MLSISQLQPHSVLTTQSSPRKLDSKLSEPALVSQSKDSLSLGHSLSSLAKKPLINLSPEVTGGVRRGGLSAGAVAGIATIGLVVAKVSNHPGYLVATALGGPHYGMLSGGVIAKYTDNKWAGAALGAFAGAAVYGGGFALASGLSTRHIVGGVVTGALLGGVSGFAANTSGW